MGFNAGVDSRHKQGKIALNCGQMRCLVLRTHDSGFLLTEANCYEFSNWYHGLLELKLFCLVLEFEGHSCKSEWSWGSLKKCLQDPGNDSKPLCSSSNKEPLDAQQADGSRNLVAVYNGRFLIHWIQNQKIIIYLIYSTWSSPINRYTKTTHLTLHQQVGVQSLHTNFARPAAKHASIT